MARKYNIDGNQIKEDPSLPKIKFDYTLQKNICMYLKRNDGKCTVDQINKDFEVEGPIVIQAMLKSLKQKKYISYDEKNVYLSDNLYYLLQA